MFHFVDSHIVSDDIKNDADQYFDPIYSELENLNCVDRHRVTQRCIGTCCVAGCSSLEQHLSKKQKAHTQTNRHYKGKNCSLVPDSVATSHMFTEESDF